MVRSSKLPHPSQYKNPIHLHLFLRATLRLLRLQIKIPNLHRNKALPCPIVHHHLPRRNNYPATWRPHLRCWSYAVCIAPNTLVYKLHRCLHFSKWLPILQTKHTLHKKFWLNSNMPCLRNAFKEHQTEDPSGLRQLKAILSPWMPKQEAVSSWMLITSPKANQLELLRIRTY